MHTTVLFVGRMVVYFISANGIDVLLGFVKAISLPYFFLLITVWSRNALLLFFYCHSEILYCSLECYLIVVNTSLTTDIPKGVTHL